MKLKRTHFATQLTEVALNTPVTVCGWVQSRRNHGGVIFIDLRDGSGILQLVFNPQINPDVHAQSERLRSEYVVAVHGTLTQRDEENINPKLPTGQIEVRVDTLEILSTSETPPFEIDDHVTVDESLRLKYRYLDLRRAGLQSRIKLRHRIAQHVRHFLDQEGFYEIETPMMIRTTPEGARDYLIPSRIHPGRFYGLPQSPQLYKQLLMVAGFERYFQIARCFRDEDLRADRQPEFTQLDMEMSFVDEADVRDVNERMIASMMKAAIGVDIALPLPVLSYNEAISRYGSDKPDTRFGLELIDFTDIMKTAEFRAFSSVAQSGGLVKGLCLKGMVSQMSRHELDQMRDRVVKWGAKGIAWISYKEEGLQSPIAKFFSEEELNQIQERAGAESGDILLFMADESKLVHDILGRLRLEMGERMNLIDHSRWDVLWVNQFPMFEWSPYENRWQAQHHPFTAPRPEDLQYLPDSPEKVYTQAYDMVINGVEVCSGSIRIHQRDVQEKVFQVLGIGSEEAEAKFGFLLKAFAYGVPPHGGIGFGFDRLVMLMAGVDTIREVIAFPKTNAATCLMAGAPGEVFDEQLKELFLKVIAPPPKRISDE